MKPIYRIVFLMILSLSVASLGAESLEGFGEKVPLEGPKTGIMFYIDWSPDGKWLAVSYMPTLDSGVYLFPVSGGNPIKLIDSNFTDNVLFSSNSQYVFLNHIIWEEQYGAIINDYGGGRVEKSNGLMIIDKINIYTGATETVAHGALYTVSPDGRFLIYLNTDYRVYLDDLQPEHLYDLAVMDMTTGEVKYTPKEEIAYGSTFIQICSFSLDSKYLVFSKFMGENRDDKKMQLFRTTIKDGTIDFEHAEQITFENESPWSKCRYGARFSPDGEWIVHVATQFTEEFSGEWYDWFGHKTGTWSRSSFSNLVALNLVSGEEIVLLPDSKTKNPMTRPCFTSKSDQICYILEDVEDQRNQGVYIFDLPEALKHGPSFVETGVPSGFALLGNYPNPFNPSTTIEFSLPEAGFMELVIYNVMGQKIRELAAGTMTPGVHSAVWVGRDDSGLAVSAGVYVTRLQMNGMVATGRMTLVK